MPVIKILPHAEYCPDGATLTEAAHEAGFAEEDEEDMLDRAWGLEPDSRLSCQALLRQQDITVEIPKYSINHAKEGK